MTSRAQRYDDDAEFAYYVIGSCGQFMTDLERKAWKTFVTEAKVAGSESEDFRKQLTARWSYRHVPEVDGRDARDGEDDESEDRAGEGCRVVCESVFAV